MSAIATVHVDINLVMRKHTAVATTHVDINLLMGKHTYLFYMFMFSYSYDFGHNFFKESILGIIFSGMVSSCLEGWTCSAI